MKSTVLFAFLVLLAEAVFAQMISKDYYNKKWEKTTKKERYYTREIFKMHDSLYSVRDYYLIDSIEMEGYFSSIEPEIEEGEFVFYYASGIKRFEGSFCEGVICGTWFSYDEHGRVLDTIKYDVLGRDCAPYDTSNNDYLRKDTLDYIIVDQMPKFVSKEYENFNDYVQSNMFIPPLVNKYKIAEEIKIEFTVDVDGSLCDFNVINPEANKSLIKEALRILYHSPRWRPAFSNRYPVQVKYMMPMNIE